jgi:hypothetical protein
MTEMEGYRLPPGIGQSFDETIALLDGLSQALDRLDEELLAGRPHAIAEAAMILEARLADAQPSFEAFRQALAVAGNDRLGIAAGRLHRSPQPELGMQLDRITTQLLSLVRRSGAGLRRAEILGAGLSASLQALRALDVLSPDQLLAEA